MNSENELFDVDIPQTQLDRIEAKCKWCGVSHKRGMNTLCPFTIAESELAKHRKIYNATNKLLCELTAEGEISARHNLVDALSDALFELDGGVFNEI